MKRYRLECRCKMSGRRLPAIVLALGVGLGAIGCGSVQVVPAGFGADFVDIGLTFGAPVDFVDPGYGVGSECFDYCEFDGGFFFDGWYPIDDGYWFDDDYYDDIEDYYDDVEDYYEDVDDYYDDLDDAYEDYLDDLEDYYDD